MQNKPPPAPDAELRALSDELDAALAGPAATPEAEAIRREEPPAVDGRARMARHRKIAALLLIGLMVATVLFYSVLVGFLALMGAIDLGDADASGYWGALTGLVVIGAAVAYTAWSFMRERGWSRIPLWIIALVAILLPPVGTAIGAYLIWVLLNTEEVAP